MGPHRNRRKPLSGIAERRVAIESHRPQLRVINTKAACWANRPGGMSTHHEDRRPKR